MRTVTDHLREHVLSMAGFFVRCCQPSLESLRETEWSKSFESLMRNRLVLGRFRHGGLGDASKPNWDRIGDAERRLIEYQQTGNLEILVDVANLMMLEFVEGRHSLRHFNATDDGSHATIKAEFGG